MPTDTAVLADRSLANTVAYFARHAAGGAAEDQDGVVLFAGAHPYPGPYCNGAIRLDRGVAVDDLLARAREFFAPRHRGFILWARAGDDADLIDRCRGEGWHERPPVEGMPIVRMERGKLRLPDDVATDAVERIRTEEDAQAYLGVLADAYEVGDMPHEILESIFCSPAAMLADEGIAVLVRVDGRPIAGSMIVSVDGVGCSLYTATIREARRSGLGAACVIANVKMTFDAGVDVIYGQSSRMGHKRWLEIGCDEVGHYHRFLVPPQR